VSFGPAIFFARRILGIRSGGSDGGRSEIVLGSRYLRGAVIGVALSIVPLVVVLIVSDGMIEGITARYIEVGTYHLQAQPLVVVDGRELEEKTALLRKSPGIKAAFPEYQGYGIAMAGARTAGVAVRAVDPSFLADSSRVTSSSSGKGSGAKESRLVRRWVMALKRRMSSELLSLCSPT